MALGWLPRALMCGIAGIISRDELHPGQLEQLAQMNQAMIHRGPDGDGHFQERHVALAMRRLSIIDAVTGQQPLYDEDGSLVLIANGEIYNYIELRNQLRERGHVFRSNGDCEVILHLYQEHGAECVHHLRGMFAFALWDKHRQTLLLARDRMGEKPLYLCEKDGVLFFASELKAFLRSGVAPFKLDATAIDSYFHYQYVPEPATPIQGVRKLKAGSILTVSARPWMVRETVYWRMEDAPPLEGNPAELIRAELETISSLVIRSDVPVGIALSGGLDSSAIAALTARKYPGTMHAFSAGYSGRPHTDERADAKAWANHLRMPFHEVEISTPQVIRSFPNVVGWQDDPIADLSSFGYWSVAKPAREHGVPVLLQGQGGDELFWGYPWVADAVRQSLRKSRVGSSEAPRLREYLELYWPRIWPRRAPVDWLLSLGGLKTSLDQYRRDHLGSRESLVFYDLTHPFKMGAGYAHKIYPQSFRESLGDTTPFDVFCMPLPWSRVEIEMTRLICQTYLLENGIARGDRLSMASSVELRLPLVDYRLVETVIGLRKTQSDVGLPPKAWFREAISDVVPDWVQRRRKRGFQAPLREWHRPLFAEYGHLLAGGTLVELGVLRPQAGQWLSEGHFPLRETEPFSLTALVLEIWCRQSLSLASGGLGLGNGHSSPKIPPRIPPLARALPRASRLENSSRTKRQRPALRMLTPRKVLHSLIWTQRHRSRQMHEPEFAFIRPFLRDDDLAIDVGAHGGSWTRLLSEAMPRGHVYAFEALPYYADVLHLTSQLNGWRNVTIINRAVMDSPHTVSMVYRDSNGGTLTGKTHVRGAGDVDVASVSVEGITLDSFMSQMGPGRVGIVKVDVEGFELPVLRGAAELIERHRPLLWCETWSEYTRRYDYTPADLFAFLEGYGYRIYTLDLQRGWSPTDARSYKGSGDVLAAPGTLDLRLVPPAAPIFDASPPVGPRE